MIKLTTLETKIILKLFEASLSKTALNKAFWSVDKKDRTSSLNNLVSNNLIEVRKVPKPRVKKTPTYYFLTTYGQKWIEIYIDTLP